MPENLKKYIEIRIDNRIIAICPVKECDSLEFIKLQEGAKKNRAALIFKYNNEVSQLKNQINELKEEIKHLKGED